ncbi:MAG: ABC transporter permease [Dehalococcoidia bacterium]
MESHQLKDITAPGSFTEIAPQVSEFRRITRVMFSRLVVIFGAIIVVVFVLTAFFAPLIAPYDPTALDLGSKLAKSSAAHLLGTDQLGRDVLSRIIYGSQISLLIGIVSVFIAAFFGMGLGLLAGYVGRWVNTIVMRFTDALLAVPPLVLMLGVAAALGGGLKNVMISVGFALIPTYIRLMCAQCLSIKQSDYITAARVIGASDVRIMGRHIFPNSFPPLLVLITTNIGIAIMAEASLSFLGIGISPPTPTWGAMVNDGYRYLLSNPLVSLAPGISILLVVLAINLVGDGLRDALDPRLRGLL